MIKTLFIIAFILIIISLGFALYALVKQKETEQSQKTVKALTVRISLSVILFICLFLAFITGMIKPHGIGANMQMQKQQPIQP